MAAWCSTNLTNDGRPHSCNSCSIVQPFITLHDSCNS